MSAGKILSMELVDDCKQYIRASSDPVCTGHPINLANPWWKTGLEKTMSQDRSITELLPSKLGPLRLLVSLLQAEHATVRCFTVCAGIIIEVAARRLYRLNSFTANRSGPFPTSKI